MLNLYTHTHTHRHISLSHALKQDSEEKLYVMENIPAGLQQHFQPLQFVHFSCSWHGNLAVVCGKDIPQWLLIYEDAFYHIQG